MTITVSRASIVGTLNAAASLVDGKSIPILGCIRLDAEGETATVRATNMEMLLTHKIRLEAEAETASFCIDAGRLADFVRRLPDNALIDFTPAANGHCKIISGESRYSLPTLPPEEFPIAQAQDTGVSFGIQADQLVAMLSKVRVCASAEPTREYLCGVHLIARRQRPDDNLVLCVEASDGHRFARQHAGDLDGGCKTLDAIIPRKAVDYFIKLFSGKSGDTSVEVSEYGTTVRHQGMSCTSRLVSGTFPDGDRLIPRSHTSSISVSRVLFQKAVERLNILQSDRDFLRRTVKLEPADRKLVIVVNDKSGEGIETLSAQVEGKPDPFYLNPRYLTDALAQIDGDTLSMEINDPLAPIVFRDSADTSAIHLVMPLRG